MPKPVNIKQPKASYRYGYGMMGPGQHAGQEYVMVPKNGMGPAMGGSGQGGGQPMDKAGAHAVTAELGNNFKNVQQSTGVPTDPGGGAHQSSDAPQSRSNPNSTQNSLQVAEIRDGIVIMNDGSFRSVIMCKAINFDLMSPNEQEAIEYSYQGFLNSLYFPIQIFLRSQKVDLQPYIQKLDKIRGEHDNMLLALLMEDYIAYIDNLSKSTNIMDKRFYIVVPFASSVESEKKFTDGRGFAEGLGSLFSTKEGKVVVTEAQLEKAKTELRNRDQAVMQGLGQSGIKGLPLDTEELIELYYDMYNPDTATRQPIKNFDDLTAKMITKGEGMAPQAHLKTELE